MKHVICGLSLFLAITSVVMGQSGSWSRNGDTYSHTGAVIRGVKSGTEFTFEYKIGPPSGYSFATISGGTIVGGLAVAIKTSTTECQITMSGTLSAPGTEGGTVYWNATATGKIDFYITSSPDPAIVPKGSSATFTAKDESGNPVSVNWTISSGGTVSPSSGTSTTASASDAGEYTGTATRINPNQTANSTLKVVEIREIQAKIGTSGEFSSMSTAIVPIGETLSVKAVMNPLCASWPNGTPEWSTSEWWYSSVSGIGEIRPVDTSMLDTGFTATATCGDSSKSINIVIFQVASISEMQSVYCTHADCSQQVEATLTGNIELPVGYSIVWGGDAIFSNISGRTATAKFAGHVGKDQVINARIGSQTSVVESSEYDVVEHNSVTGISVPSFSFTSVALNSSQWGLTVVSKSNITVSLTAYFTHPNHKWQCKIQSCNSVIQQSSQLLSGIGEATVAACISQDIYRQMYADLSSTAGTRWFMLAAVQAHEKVHSDDYKTIFSSIFPAFKSTIEGIELDYGGQTVGDAADEIKTSSGYTEAFDNMWDDIQQEYNKPEYCHPGCDTRTNAAEFSVLLPRRTELVNHAASQNPPWTL